MNLREALRMTVDRLEQAQIPDARLDAEYLVARVAGIPRLRLALDATLMLRFEEEQLLSRWVQERLDRKPLAYILGEQPFMNIVLRVNPGVLIPRPETELLVEEAYRLLDRHTAAVVVDVGTGSGNIAISLAQHAHVAEVHAIDISHVALDLAEENALRNMVKKPIHWHQGDLLMPMLHAKLQADLIVANLPYIKRKELPTLSPEVHWEPTLALDGGHDGLAYISHVIRQAAMVLRPEGFLLLEIGYEQGSDVLELIEKSKGWMTPELFQDLAGLPRIIKAQKGVLIGSLND